MDGNGHRKLIVTNILFSGLGGHGSVFFSLVRGDRERQFEFKAVFCGIEPVREEYRRECESLNVPYQAFLKKKGIDFQTVWGMVQALRRQRPDMVFIHGAGFILPVLLYKLLRPSLRIIVRDTQAHHLKNAMEWRWLKMSIRLADRIVLLSAESLAALSSRLRQPMPSEKICIVPNGLDTDRYVHSGHDNRNGMIVIGMQSRLQRIKDHPTLLKAFAQLSRSRPDLHLQLRIAGDGETRSGLEALADQLGIRSVVVFTGMLGQDALLAFMQELHYYVHATEGEMMSNSIMQAMSCQLPVIGSDVWGVNNMIHDEVNGLLYKHGDVDALATQLLRVVTDTQLAERLSRAARAYAVEHFSLQTMFDRYREVFTA